jgi:homoserine kinase type II
MAVYTEVGFDEADALLQRLGLGALTDLQGIRSGIENTNYYATTVRGQWVLTLFERLPREQLPYYLRLMQHLARHGIPVPAPQADADGELVHTLAGKPAAVVTRLPGSHRLAPDADHCAQVGAMLARMHLAGRDFALQQPHLRGLAWWQTVPVVLPHLQPAQAALLRDELAFQQQRWPRRRPARRCRAAPSTPTCSATT